MFFTKIIDWIDPVKVVAIAIATLALIVFFGYLLPDVGFGNGMLVVLLIALIVGAILTLFTIKILIVKGVQKTLNWTETEADETVSKAFNWLVGFTVAGAILGFLFAGWGPGNPMRFIESPYGFADPRITKLWFSGTVWGLIFGLLIGAAITYLKLFYRKEKSKPELKPEPQTIIIHINTADDAELARVFTPEEIQRIHNNRKASANCGYSKQKPFYCNHHLWTATDPGAFRPEMVLQGERVLEISSKLSSHELEFEF